MSTGSTANVPLTVEEHRANNLGAGCGWAVPVVLSLAARGRRSRRHPVGGGMRTLFPRPVLPGESVALVAQVRAPSQPGHYRLLWDIEEDRRRWFSREPGATLFVSRTSVSGAATAAPPSSPRGAWAKRAGGAPALWRAAARMLADHPLRGVGPGNFRCSTDRTLTCSALTRASTATTCTSRSSSAGALSPESPSHG